MTTQTMENDKRMIQYVINCFNTYSDCWSEEKYGEFDLTFITSIHYITQYNYRLTPLQTSGLINQCYVWDQYIPNNREKCIPNNKNGYETKKSTNNSSKVVKSSQQNIYKPKNKITNFFNKK